MLKYEFYPLGLENECQKQQDRLSLYKCRLQSFLSQEMQDPKLEEYIRHKIDEASVDIHFLEIMATWGGFRRSYRSVPTSRSFPSAHAVGTSDAAGIHEKR